MKRLAVLSLSMLVALAFGGCGSQPAPEQVAETTQEETAEQVDRGELNAAIDEASGTDFNDYTDESGQALRTALSDARAMLGKSGATQEEIDGAIEALEAARADLVPYPEADKSQLKAVISEAEALQSSDYAQASYTRLSDALATARIASGNKRASQGDVDSATQALRGAIDSLEPAPTTSQLNAVALACDYIDYKGFSWQGLVDQLEYEGFSTEDAEYGASHCGADWSVQAERLAKDYMDYRPFSRSGLIDQLQYEGFSYDEAAHGADSVGL